MSSTKWNTWSTRSLFGDSGHPGEPLYTLDEIADKLHVDEGNLRGMLHWHSGLVPWMSAKSKGRGNGSVRSHKNLYRLSDARKWWREVSKS